jgi:hypothetical protein
MVNVGRREEEFNITYLHLVFQSAKFHVGPTNCTASWETAYIIVSGPMWSRLYKPNLVGPCNP